MTKVILQNFGAGIVNDPRDTSNGVSRVVTNFDITTSPTRLIPYVSSEDGDSAASTSKKQNFCLALWLPGSTNVWRLFALGVQSGTGKAEILMKDLTTGASTDLDDNSWATPSANQAASASTNFELFIYYKRTGLIYGAHGGTSIWAFDPTTSAAFADTSHSLTYNTSINNYSGVTQGIVHSKDDTMYFGRYNSAGAAGAKSFITKYDGTTWTDSALALPDQYIVTSICEFNNYIAIALAPLSRVGNSRIYLWDRSTTLTTVTENIDAGSGNVSIIEELDGYLVWISSETSQAGGNRYKEKINFRYYTGAGAHLFKQLINTTSSNSLPIVKQKINNRVHFLLVTTLNGAVREGVWSFGRNENGLFTLNHERTSNNDTALGNGVLKGFIYVGDFLFISSISNSSTYQLLKTDDASTYSATSIFESQINPNMPATDKIKLKKLSSISVGYKTLSGINGQVVVKYKVDGGSYVTALTATTTGMQVFETKDAVGVPFTDGREFEFRIESTLGAEIIELGYDYSVIPTLA